MKLEGLMVVEVIYMHVHLRRLDAANDAFANAVLNVDANETNCQSIEPPANSHAEAEAKSAANTDLQSEV